MYQSLYDVLCVGRIKGEENSIQTEKTYSPSARKLTYQLLSLLRQQLQTETERSGKALKLTHEKEFFLQPV